ncbi:MAG TPA: cation:proton antiporter [Stenotrophomonas sp.]|jgi:Kef-type K+ transport system membrane component KefB
MQPIIATALDAALFIGLAWAIWRALGRSFPIAVVPIVIGMVLAYTHWVPTAWGVPSAGGQTLGWIGVLLLAFTAGIETRHLPEGEGTAAPAQRDPALRVLSSAAVALLLPFAAGALVAYHLLAEVPAWVAPAGNRLAGALGVGLCIAVSALPVLIGIVRELGPKHRRLTDVALRLAVIDDAVLWIGLALLLLYAQGQIGFHWSGLHVLAVALPAAMLAAGPWLGRRTPPSVVVWLALPLWLAMGAWASSTLGLHEILGAYFAGAMVPPAWLRRVPVERIARFALIGLAPLFFGHSGMKIDGDVLGWSSLQAALGLLVLAVAAKLAAVLLVPPVRELDRRDTLAIGMLLQCKGLMEIVAATILRDAGLLSEYAFATLVSLAVLSTLMTGPLFRLIVRRRASAAPSPDPLARPR